MNKEAEALIVGVSCSTSSCLSDSKAEWLVVQAALILPIAGLSLSQGETRYRLSHLLGPSKTMKRLGSGLRLPGFKSALPLCFPGSPPLAIPLHGESTGKCPPGTPILLWVQITTQVSGTPEVLVHMAPHPLPRPEGASSLGPSPGVRAPCEVWSKGSCSGCCGAVCRQRRQPGRGEHRTLLSPRI